MPSRGSGDGASQGSRGACHGASGARCLALSRIRRDRARATGSSHCARGVRARSRTRSARRFGARASACSRARPGSGSLVSREAFGRPSTRMPRGTTSPWPAPLAHVLLSLSETARAARAVLRSGAPISETMTRHLRSVVLLASAMSRCHAASKAAYSRRARFVSEAPSGPARGTRPRRRRARARPAPPLSRCRRSAAPSREATRSR